MNHFTISDIESLTGIKAHTLRIWEQRYSVCNGKRKDSGHRYYDDEDLKRMLRLATLYRNGYKISRLAGMEEEELRLLANGFCRSYVHQTFLDQLTLAAQSFDSDQFGKLLSFTCQHFEFEKAVTEVFYPFLEKMGMLWLTDQAVPAQEHFSSTLIRNKIINAIDSLPPPVKKDKTVLIFTPEGEAHEIPVLLMQYLLKKQGRNSIYLGTQVNLNTLKYICDHKKPAFVYFHLITHLSNQDLVAYIKELSVLAGSARIIVSGPAMTARQNEMPGGIRILSSLDDFFTFGQTI